MRTLFVLFYFFIIKNKILLKYRLPMNTQKFDSWEFIGIDWGNHSIIIFDIWYLIFDNNIWWAYTNIVTIPNSQNIMNRAKTGERACSDLSQPTTGQEIAQNNLLQYFLRKSCKMVWRRTWTLLHIQIHVECREATGWSSTRQLPFLPNPHPP